MRASEFISEDDIGRRGFFTKGLAGAALGTIGIGSYNIIKDRVKKSEEERAYEQYVMGRVTDQTDLAQYKELKNAIAVYEKRARPHLTGKQTTRDSEAVRELEYKKQELKDFLDQLNTKYSEQ